MSNKSPSKGAAASKPMTVRDAARIQSATAKATGGNVPKDSFAARAMSSAAKNAK